MDNENSLFRSLVREDCCANCASCIALKDKSLYCGRYGLRRTAKYNSCEFFDRASTLNSLKDGLVGRVQTGG